MSDTGPMTDVAERWVLDASSNNEMGLRAFCPLTEDDAVLVGLTLLTDLPPGPVVGVFHDGGQEACDAWCAAHPEVMAELFGTDQLEGNHD